MPRRFNDLVVRTLADGLLSAVLAVSLVACADPRPSMEHLDDYVFALRYHDGFNILQLTDIHWSVNTSTASSMRYLDKVIKEAHDHIQATQGPSAKIDLVELTGDLFMLANAYHVDTFIDYFERKAEEYGFVYAPIWGNHDRQSLINPDDMAARFERAGHCLYTETDDDVYGRSNYIVNLTDDGTRGAPVAWMIANMDSGACFSETELSITRDYDYLRPDQTDWFIAEHERAGERVPAIAYYHIPQDENEKAWQAVTVEGKDLKNKFFRLEGFDDNGKDAYASDFIDRARGHNLKAAFMGHAHNVDWTVLYEGVVIGLGVKTGDELYYAHVNADSDDEATRAGLTSVGITEDFDLLGASLVTLEDKDGSFALQHLYYNEREGGDFAAWVTW